MPAAALREGASRRGKCRVAAIVKRTLIFIVVLVVLVGVIGGFGYFQFVVKPQLIREVIAGSPRPPTTVAAQPATLESWLPQLRAVGSLIAVQGIEVAPEVSGIVTAVHFQSGDEVVSGAPLFDLDDSTNQADLQSALATLRQMELEQERQRTLLAQRNTSQANFDRSLADRDTADAAVQRVQAVIAQKSVVAPFDGRLGLRQLDVGEFVAAGTPVVTLQQLDPIHLDFSVPEQAIPNIAVGQAVEVAVEAYPDRAFAGTVQAINARVDQATRNIQVRAELANPDRQLLPGMFATVRVVIGEAQPVVTVTETAITYSLYGDSVFVVVAAPSAEGAQAAGPTPENATTALAVERRFVTVGETRGTRTSVVAGLAAGEIVVSEGQIKLWNGAPVVVDNQNALAEPAALPRE
ncbi:MAG: efflux RND transporter periplasmic adaptor subunit [Alphaproteobacteria bacterium]